MSEIKQIVSLRLENSKREKIQNMAARLAIREADLYRIAISYTLKNMADLMDEFYSGSDLLPVFLDIREHIISNCNFNKNQLFNIFNSGSVTSDKFVAMTDIELLLTPAHKLKPNLIKVTGKTAINHHNDAELLLKQYLVKKYNLSELKSTL